MGQYFQVFNLDKKQKLHPHLFNDGLKLLEFGSSGQGTMFGLSLLLRQSSEFGGGDFNYKHGLVDLLLGSWAGDRISIVGDYDDSDIYDHEAYVDISNDVVEMIKLHPYFAEKFKTNVYV
jgi:hypothetical protein